MSVQIRDDLPGIDEASAELDRLMSEDQQAAGAQTEQGESANEQGQSAQADRAAQTQEADAQKKTDQLTTDPKAGTPAAADKAKLETKAADAPDKTAKEQQQQQQQSQSRFAKEVERRNRTWAEVNAQKEAVKTERAELDRQKAEFQKLLDETEQTFSPEDYLKAAADFEAKGNLEMAEAARNKAKQLKDNPDPKAVSRKARLEERKKETQAQTKEWTLKAGVDFPDVAKNGSPLQTRVAELLREDPDFKAHPKGIYVAARIASLEAVAASVPDKDKELVQLRQKVSELEKATSPGGEGGPAPSMSEKAFDQMTQDEQFAALEREAHSIGAIR